MDRLPSALTDLLARVATGTIPSDTESNAVFDTLTPSHRKGLVASLHAALGGDNPDVAAGAVLRKAIDRLDARTAETQGLVASLLEGLDAAEGDPESDPAAAIAAAEDAVEVAAEAVAVVAEVVPADEPAAAEAVATAEDLIAEADAAVAEAQVAAIRPNISRPKVTVAKKHATVAVRPRTIGLAASMAAPSDLRSVGEVFARNAHAHQVVGRMPLVQIDTEYLQDRTLKRGDLEGNTAKLDAALGVRALAASGGICDPLIGDQDHQVFGVTDRPVRDGLPGFGTTDVGGVRYAPAFILGGGQLGTAFDDVTPFDPKLGNIDGPGIWTHAADLAPDTAVKPCWVIPCEEELEARVDAVTFCAQIGVFAQRFSGNLWTRALDAGAIAHARAAEQHLLGLIDAASVDVTYTGSPATTVRQVITGIGNSAEHLRNSNRLGNAVIQAIMPDWIQTALRADITSKQLAAGTPPEQIGVTDAQIAAIFAAWKVAPIFTQDLDILPGATAGALGAYPTTKAYIFPYGTHVFLDGGRFDTGVMIDPQLMETNDLKLFFETFEGLLNYHAQSIELAIPIAEGLDCCV